MKSRLEYWQAQVPHLSLYSTDDLKALNREIINHYPAHDFPSAAKEVLDAITRECHSRKAPMPRPNVLGFTEEPLADEEITL